MIIKKCVELSEEEAKAFETIYLIADEVSNHFNDYSAMDFIDRVLDQMDYVPDKDEFKLFDKIIRM